MCHPLAPFLLVAPVARSACRQVSELCECCACVCSLGMRLRALDARAAVECVAGVMASAIELEIQERRVKKARLDVEEEEINVRRMELALQRSKVELPAGARAVDGARHARRLRRRRGAREIRHEQASERVWWGACLSARVGGGVLRVSGGLGCLSVSGDRVGLRGAV